MRKSMVLSVLLMVLSLVMSSCAGAGHSGQTREKKSNSEDSLIINQEKFYQFQRPGKRWNKYGPDKFNDYWFVGDNGSTIYIGSLTSTEALTWVQHSWFDGMQKKYKWESMEIVDERILWMGNINSPWFLEAKALWSVIEYKSGDRTWKEKIYLVDGDKFYYRLRFSCPKRYFGRHLKEFEQLVKSLKILEKTPSSTEPAAEDKETLCPTKPPDETPGETPSEQAIESVERPEWKKGNKWIYKYRFLGDTAVLEALREVVGKKRFEGTLCYVVRGQIGIKVYHSLDLNHKAFTKDGRNILKWTPDHPLLDWPLEVGKAWNRTYVYKEKDREPETIKAEFKVVKKEKIKVPAGEFRAFKIVEKVNGSVREVVWYAPEAKNLVRIESSTHRKVVIWELLEYKL